MSTRYNEDLFRRLSSFTQGLHHSTGQDSANGAQEVRKRPWDDEVARITQGRTYMYKQAQWAADLVEELVDGPEPTTRLPKEVLNSCDALCFCNAQKGACFVTGGYGYGFIIKKVKQEGDGTSKWSPPFFFTISQAGMGFSFGYQHSQTVMALVNQAAVDKFMSGGFTAGTDVCFYSTDGALTGMAAGVLGWRQQRSQKDGFSYSIVRGAYSECGFHGSRFCADASTNSKLYEYTSGADVLNAAVTRHFPEVDCLYNVINRLGKEAAASAQGGLDSTSIGRMSNMTNVTDPTSQRQDSHVQRGSPDQLPPI